MELCVIDFVPIECESALCASSDSMRSLGLGMMPPPEGPKLSEVPKTNLRDFGTSKDPNASGRTHSESDIFRHIQMPVAHSCATVTSPQPG